MANRTDQVPSKRICIIGAGSSGLAVLKYLSETSYFKKGLWSVVAYESRPKVGGIWYSAPPTNSSDPPLSSLYDSLTTNIPHPIMAYTEYPFPPSTPLFPQAAIVQTYLESYASHFDLLPFIRFNVSVIHATWVHDHWRITLSTGEVLDFDNLVIANGHYKLPNIPDIPGLDHWMKMGTACHSAWYRRPHGFGPKVLVVGSGPSGMDIAAEIRNHGCTVIHSLTGTILPDEKNYKMRGRPLQFYPDGRVLFEHDTVEGDINHCILATGFQIDFPFFDEDTIKIDDIPITGEPTIPPDFYNSRFHVFPLAKNLFPLQSRSYPPSSAAFMTLGQKIVPFPIAEAQARAIVRAFADPTSLDPKQEGNNILARSHVLKAAGASTSRDFAKAWTRFRPGEQWKYRDELFAYAAESGDCPATKVASWVKDIYANKSTLRAAWKELESKGESQKWVEGVGQGGIQEWIDMMYRLLRQAEGHPLNTDQGMVRNER